MIEAIWPSSATWHLNSLPKSDAIMASQLLCFSLFWLASFSFLLISVKSLRWIFLVKIVLMPFFYVALFTWALTAGNGFGPLFSIPNNIRLGGLLDIFFARLYLLPLAVMPVRCAFLSLSHHVLLTVLLAFAVNMADITRYAREPRNSTIAQAVALPFFITMSKWLSIATVQVPLILATVELLGAIMAATAQVV